MDVDYSVNIEKNEFIKDGALSEIKEETGLDAKLDGIIQIGNQTIDDDKLIYIIFFMIILVNIQIYNSHSIVNIIQLSYAGHIRILHTLYHTS